MRLDPRLSLESILVGLLILAGTSHAAPGGVHIVTPGGNQSFPTIQAAVDAAAEGDVLMLGAGTYGGFTVDGKGLALHAVQPGQAQVQGAVLVRNLPAGRTLLLDGLSIAPATPAVPGLEVVDCAGFVRVEHASVVGGPASKSASTGAGHPGVRVQGSFQVLFADCQLTGSSAWGSGSFNEQGAAGGDGLRVVVGAVALYDCTLLGGVGGLASIFGGAGGHGARVQTGGLFASGSFLTGGKGGYADDFLPANGGPGGHGLRVESTGQAQLVENTLQGGAGGGIFDPNGQVGTPGLPISAATGATVIQHAVGRRVYETQPIVGDAQALGVAVTGQAGDALFLLRGPQASWKVQLPTTGILTVLPFAKQLYYPLGTLAGTSGIVQLPLPDMGPAVTARQFFAQGLVRPLGGGKQLGSPFSLLVLGRGALPDCDGDGVNDYLALVEGTVADCDGNLVPDACDIANGFDCNGNGVVDACDIAAGTSPDENGNGVPDECDPVNAVWHVNAAASAGGNGSLAFPFKTIGEGVAIALSGDTVLVADGVYTGSGNRHLDFDGRDLVVRSANGPANCIIDLQNQGRAFEFVNTFETAASRIEGFTIRNGNAQLGTQFPGSGGGIALISADTTVRECVFEGNSANQRGGGMYLSNGGGRVENCVFRANQIPDNGSAEGGAGLFVSAGLNDRPVVVGCLFEQNVSAGGGGGLRALSTQIAVTNCTFYDNQAVFGGGVYLNVFVSEPGNFSNCLVVGNRATGNGGGILGADKYQMSNCTIAFNSAFGTGGGLHQTASLGGGTSSLVNCLLWGNQAGVGAQVGLGSSGKLTVAYCNLQGGTGAVYVDGFATFTSGAGLIDVDPLFADPLGPDLDPLTFDDNDYRLGALSPCADAGHNAYVALDWADLDGDANVTEQVPFDLAGAARVQDDPAVPDTGVGPPPIVDLGAYERP